MNRLFYFDICAFFVFITILWTAYYKKMLKGKTNILFYIEMALCSVTCFFSILCSIFFRFVGYNLFTYILTYFFEYIYIILHSLILPVAVLYILSSVGILLLYENKFVYSFIFIILVAVPLLFVIDNLFSNELFTITKNLTLVFGQHYKYIYLVDIIYIIICVSLVIIYRNFLHRSKIIIAILMCPIIISFIFIEFYFPYYRVLLFVYAIIGYLVNSSSQRPELLINPSIGVWSDYSFYNECKKYYLLNKPGTVVFIKILNYKSLVLYLGRNNYYSFVRQTTSHISYILRNCYLEDCIYYLENFTFAIYLEKISDELLSLIVGDLYYELSHEIDYDNFRIMLDPLICVAKLPKDIKTYENLKFFSKSFHHILPERNGLVWLSNVVHSKEFKIKNEIEGILNKAIKENRLQVYFQPIYSLKENRFTCAEALLRLYDSEYGFIPPSIFLPPAESNGSILHIGDFVLEEVCKFIASEEFNNLGLKYIEINLSLSQCAEENLPEKIMGMLDKYSIDPSKLRLEINESIVEANPAVTKENISLLTEKGVFFVLDNYGVGYSNIRNVTRIPFTLIKLDKSFLNDLQDEKMLTVLQDVIQMLKALKKEVLVEGVENESAVRIFNQLDCDLVQGCEYVQGYYYSKPLPKDEFIDFLNHSNNPPETISL